MLKHDSIRRAKTAIKFALHNQHEENLGLRVKGLVTFDMRDARTGEVLCYWQKDNIVLLDAGILTARLYKDNAEPPHGINMLAVGTGALGAILNPDAPPVEQRRLNNEIERKAFDSTTFRDSSGAAVSIPTNVVNFTTIFNQSEAVGPQRDGADVHHLGQPNRHEPEPQLRGARRAAIRSDDRCHALRHAGQLPDF